MQWQILNFDEYTQEKQKSQKRAYWFYFWIEILTNDKFLRKYI